MKTVCIAWMMGCALMCSRAVAFDDAADVERAKAQIVRAALARITPSIVTIETVGGAQPVRQRRPGGPMVEESFKLGEGPTTGLILTRDGLIITSSFNFIRDPSIITVTLSDGRRLVAKLVGRDLIRRLALLKVDANGLPAPRWASLQEIDVGQYAIACGRGLSGPSPFVSLGIISAMARRNGNSVKTDTKVSPINSGGPRHDIEGRVLGVLVPMAGADGDLAGAQWYDSGIGFAIYKSKIDAVLNRLVAGETIEPGKIGVVLEPDEPSLLPLLDKLLPPNKGVKIGGIAKNSPASHAHLESGDKIIALDGQPTGDLLELQRRLSDRAAGETITLTIRRRWQTIEAKIKLASDKEISAAMQQGKPRDNAPAQKNENDDPAKEPTTQPSRN